MSSFRIGQRVWMDGQGDTCKDDTPKGTVVGVATWSHPRAPADLVWRYVVLLDERWRGSVECHDRDVERPYVEVLTVHPERLHELWGEESP